MDLHCGMSQLNRLCLKLRLGVGSDQKYGMLPAAQAGVQAGVSRETVIPYLFRCQDASEPVPTMITSGSSHSSTS